MGLAPYARREAAAIGVLGALATAAVAWGFGWWGLVPAALSAGLLAFYRDPHRSPPPAPAGLLAPADGRVIDIQRQVSVPELAGPALRVLIFLSIWDVHVNRSPCAGRIAAVRYRPGRFCNALRRRAAECNECNTVVLEPAGGLPGPVVVRQIAGALARRIVCAVQPGQCVAGGERIGMIKLGSQTELCVPEDPRWEVAVRTGMHVRAGITVILRWHGHGTGT